MAIEFRCSQCGRLLRVADDAAGKQARCPECKTLSTIPAPPAAGPSGSAGQGQPSPFGPPGASGSPFGTAGAEGAGSLFGPGGAPTPSPSDSENPYQSPTQYSQPVAYVPAGPDPMAASRVAGPAIGLIVAASLNIAINALGLIVNLVQLGGAPRGQDVPPAVLAVIFLVVYGLIFALSGVVINGAVKMKHLERYGLAFASAIIGMIPCFYPCCIVGLPFGIWALVVLSDARVKAAFRS